MPVVDTDKYTRIPAARMLLVTGASVAAALTTAVAVPASVASESPTTPAPGLPQRNINQWPKLTAQWPTASQSVTRPVASSSSSTGHYSIPASIVMCESGGDYHAVNPSTGAGGAYQIMPSTWASYGGTGLPQDAPPAEQDAIAAKIYATDGRGAWSC
jgi:hypothetical protein